jgi:hypothetical protein
MNGCGDLTQLVAVLAGVVGAEEQLSTTLELNPEVGLGAASVATVGSTECCGTGGNGSGHWGLFPTSCWCLANVARRGKIPGVPLDRTIQSCEANFRVFSSTPRHHSREDLPKPHRSALDRAQAAGEPAAAYGVSRVDSSGSHISGPAGAPRSSTTPTTPPISSCWRASRPSANARGCTSVPPTPED